MAEDGLAEVASEACVLLGAGAAVLEQLAMRPVGLGVAERSTTLERPLERLRTTLTYVYVLALGSPEEQRAVARMVNRAHAPVRSPGRYDAFDPDLQLWVAATLAHEGARLHQQVFGPGSTGFRERVHGESAIYATALQVSPAAWPADAAAFERYGQGSLRRLEPDPAVQAFARRLLSSRGQPLVVRLLLPLQSLMARGGVPAEVREVLALPWSARDQRRYELFWRVFPPVYRRIPRPVRSLPARFYLRDFRRRRARGRPVL
ncbi:MAG TPA: oxygenase MpaB family protein [Marmoricola sp.]|nr:oxygenase MpaB family protein [Marmoricola sp.]